MFLYKKKNFNIFIYFLDKNDIIKIGGNVKKKRRLKKSAKKFLILSIISLLLFIFIVVGIIKKINYLHSYDYKLSKIGYSKEEIVEIKKQDNNTIDNLLTKKYNKLNVKLMKQKYFIFSNLDEYIKYYKETDNDDLANTITMVNVKANNDYYDKEVVKQTDISKNNLMLVNKFHNLAKDYSPKDLVDVPNTYGYGTNQIKKEVYENFLNMWNDAKKEKLSLIITSAYRDYKYQDQLWTSYSASKGDKWADSVAARAGYSEHQTGLAIDVVTYGSTMDSFEKTDEFKWLNKNAYKYGFILRYPKGKEKITGYSYESWHYRYVGKEIAKKIHKEKITFDEYYAYYIENKKD